MLVAERWVIRDPAIETIQQSLGGEIVTLAPADGPANMADTVAFDEGGVVEADPVPADGAPAAAEPASGIHDVLVVID